ncbi:hypothetical protein NUU61_003600 [Penicillium alfredii]|uniref:Uncharacterized protein n=1 Tax=Penicillium alfredii TaxID=1506179 RepID=A0A9W9FJI1_9EURO|nr:uncharacterized protein NUU61_003600 [Penicillium alfredii]KAJ5101378.1 hypothetical protein NUU61_003600 [Penicillium alfredii]
MSLITLHIYLLALALFLVSATAIPRPPRDLQWSFDLYPGTSCNGTADPQAAFGSTKCRANLRSVASAYQLHHVAEGCRIEFFDNTMCDRADLAAVAKSSPGAPMCRPAGPVHRVGSYQVTCD